ncbi:MAG TPA: nuclear transport factor 2 family protein [Kofleriaceae bacterium]|jgi:hypothetical protein
MSLETVSQRFVELCSQGKNFDVMKSMYAPNIVSVEADGKETAGKDPVIKKSEVWGANNKVNGEKVRGPFPNSKNQFAVYFTFDVTREGKPVTIEEIGLYTVENDQITREQFFYEGKH